MSKTTKTLLETAKELKSKYRKGSFTDEEIELALAALKDEISVSQAAKASNIRVQSMRFRLFPMLKQAFRQGTILIELPEKQ